MHTNIQSITQAPNSLHHTYTYEIVMDEGRNHFGSIDIDIINGVVITSIKWCVIDTDPYYDKHLFKDQRVLNYEVDISYYEVDWGCTCQEILDGYVSLTLDAFAEELVNYLMIPLNHPKVSTIPKVNQIEGYVDVIKSKLWLSTTLSKECALTKLPDECSIYLYTKGKCKGCSHKIIKQFKIINSYDKTVINAIKAAGMLDHNPILYKHLLLNVLSHELISYAHNEMMKFKNQS